MRICIAQTRPVKGDISKNIEDHKRFISLAVAHGANTIIFPELSITGYEPGLAKDLATDPGDPRFNALQKLSDQHKIHICAGMPLRTEGGIHIGMIIFSPDHPRQNYTKQYLHEDELPFFVAGQKKLLRLEEENQLSLAICYEISVPAHSENAFRRGAQIYLASVAKTVNGVAKAIETLSDMAGKYGMTVLMANCVGHCDDFDCGGRSSAWNTSGELVGQLDETSESILIMDTGTQELIEVSP